MEISLENSLPFSETAVGLQRKTLRDRLMLKMHFDDFRDHLVVGFPC